MHVKTGPDPIIARGMSPAFHAHFPWSRTALLSLLTRAVPNDPIGWTVNRKIVHTFRSSLGGARWRVRRSVGWASCTIGGVR